MSGSYYIVYLLMFLYLHVYTYLVSLLPRVSTLLYWLPDLTILIFYLNMALDFGEYMTTYLHSGPGDADDEVSPLLKLNVDCVYYVMIDTDQNINYLEIERHSRTRDLLDIFVSSGFLTTETLPTRITHNTSTLIDNIYIKCKHYDEFVSGIISVDISDHLSLFTFVEQHRHTKSPPKRIIYRPVDEIKLTNIQNYLNSVVWNIFKIYEYRPVI